MLNHQDLTAVKSAAQIAVQSSFGSHHTISSIERWGGGAHNTGFKLTLQNETRLYMKIEKEGILPRTRRCQIEREVYGIELAAQAGVNVPRVIGYDFSGEIAGCRYLLEEFIDQDLLGMALEKLPDEQRSPLLAEFQSTIHQLDAIENDIFGELYAGGWLGQYASWRAMLSALSTIVLEDAQFIGSYSDRELDVIQNAHTISLETIHYSGPAVLTHNDLHEYNIFIERQNGSLRVGKLFDFGLSLFQAKYLSCCGLRGYDGKEMEIARQFNVTETELRSVGLISDLEFVNFANVIQFAPDQPYGYIARSKRYLESCRALLGEQYGLRGK